MLDLHTGMNQQQKMQLSQKLSPQMIQSISLMALPVVDLCEKIYEEVDKNPALEITKNAKFETGEIRVTSKYSSSEISDTHQAFIESVPDRTQTLQESLFEQLEFLKISEKQKKLAKKIIQNLDNKGYFVDPPEKVLEKDEDENMLEETIKIIQSFEPSGICCSGLKESLIIQTEHIQATAKIPKLVLPLLNFCFENLQHPRPSLILPVLKKIPQFENENITIQDIENALNFIQTLDPYPAGQFATDEKKVYISPDIIIRRASDEEKTDTGMAFIIEFVKGNLPELEVAETFTKFSGKNKFVQDSIKDAQWFINSIQQRNLTLLKTVKAILEVQQPFFMNGPKFLQPLRMKDIADKIEVHETTISRIANGKYISCEWGLFEIKYFFTNAISAVKKIPQGVAIPASVMANAAETAKLGPSKESVKQEIKAILQSETKKLSDSKLTEILASRGINIARRTVAKYRAELNISSSFDR